MTKDISARARGRPRKPVVDGERPVVTLRLVPETRRRLEQAADANGWSLALEASSRLDQSFAEDAQLGSHVAMLTRAIGGLARLIEQSTGRSFLDDYLTSYAVQVAVNRALTAVAPPMPDNEATRYASADVLDRQSMPMPDATVLAEARRYEAALNDAHDLGSKMAHRFAVNRNQLPERS